jgi:uncharacterized caspase-like protein
MTDMFDHGYSLLIGVGSCSYNKWSLPVTVKDTKAVFAVLSDPALCSFLPDNQHIRVLNDYKATRDGIVYEMKWLRDQANKDSNATCIVYYSGHGWLDTKTGEYYLIPHDVDPLDVRSSALPAPNFISALREIRSKQLLVIIDSCHAEGMGTSKDSVCSSIPLKFNKTAIPDSVKNELKKGEGRAVFTASRGNQLSWILPNQSMSIYTYHFLEALRGAGNLPGDKFVRLSNVMNHLSRSVPESAQEHYKAEQTPFFDTTTEDFPIALLQGGKGLPSGGWNDTNQESTERQQLIIKSQSGGVSFNNSGTTSIGGNVIGGDQNNHEHKR